MCFPCRNVFKGNTAGYNMAQKNIANLEKRLRMYNATGQGESEAAQGIVEYLDRYYTNMSGSKCALCKQNGTCVPKSFRAPSKSDDAGWTLAEQLADGKPLEHFPEFKHARPGTLARCWVRLDSFQHAPEATWAKMWYPTHENQIPEWVQFMTTTQYLPSKPPAYTKAQKAALL